VARRYYSHALRLVAQSQDAALAGVQVFNNPLIGFKSETFIVLMNIAWTYLLHAHYRREGVEYRYYRRQGKRRRFERTDDDGFKYWDLTRCITANESPLDGPTTKNLRFLIGLRNEITHHISPELDQYVSARYQACCLNYNRYAKEPFGVKYGIDRYLSYSLQFQNLSREQLAAPEDIALPPNVRSFIARFDNGLSAEDLNSDHFAYRMLFVPKLVGKAGQADEVIEFLKPDSEIAKSLNRDYLAFKEVERPKYRPTHVVELMQEEGFTHFTIQNHTDLWKELDAKDEAKGYGVWLETQWFWYGKWVDVVREHCMQYADDYR
jgi:Protein of unknown function (DUF3644)